MQSRKQETLYVSLKDRKKEINKTLLSINMKVESLNNFGLQDDIIDHQKQFDKLSSELELIEKLEEYYDIILDNCY